MEQTIISYSEGRGNLGKVKNKQKSWARFKQMFSTPSRTSELFKEYIKLTVSQKLELKRADGYFCAASCKDGFRRKENILDRVLLTLDLDENADKVLESYLDGTNMLCKVESFIQTSRSHSPKHPKFRMVILLDRPIDKEEHQALSRIVASKVDPSMRSIDPVSHRMAQMMFKPTSAKDGDFIFKEYQTGKALNVDKVFATFEKKVGDWHNVANLPKNPEREEMLRNTMAKAEDPWAKVGPVGTWCRAWPIEDLIAEHLTDYYYPADGETGSEPRYTPVGASGSSGVVVYGDGRFIYSNHTSDPISEKNVNAWDLMRLCKFDHLDEKKDPDTPNSKLPSWMAMFDFAKKEPRYQAQAVTERYEDLDEKFTDDDVADGDDGEANDSSERTETQSNLDNITGRDKQKEPKRQKNWKKKLDLIANGKFKSSFPNVRRVIRNDLRMWEKLGYNELTATPVLLGTIRTKIDDLPDYICENEKSGDILTDQLDATIRAMLAEEKHYGINASERDLKDGVMTAAIERKFHPVRDLFIEWSENWDSKERMATVPTRYLGTPDNDYTREVFSNTMIALVGRQIEPGLKFHNMIVLQAPVGGEGKSLFCELMGLRDYYTDLQVNLEDPARCVEGMAGNIVCELGEMKAHNKASSAAVLSFLSRTEEQVRVAYAKKTARYPRQSIVISTTNRESYIKEAGGSRRYWPLHIVGKSADNQIDNPGFEEEYPMIVAEAVHAYRALREKHPTGDLPLDLQGKEAREEQRRLVNVVKMDTPAQELAAEIEEWVQTPVSLAEIGWAHKSDRDGFNDDEEDGHMVLRTRTCSREIKDAFMVQGASYNHLSSHIIGEAVETCPALIRPGTKKRCGHYGNQFMFMSNLRTWTPVEFDRGWAEITPPNDYSDLI